MIDKDNMPTRSDVENSRLNSTADLAELVEKLGYGNNKYSQLQFPNGSFLSSVSDFFDDNPGALEAVAEWILENSDLNEEDEDEDEDDEIPTLE